MHYKKAITKFFLGLVVFSLILGGVNSAFAEAAPPSPEQTAVQFYKWYLHELNRERDPRTGQKRKLLAFLSRRFGKWLYSIPDDEYGADVFIDAQDFDKDWEQTITTSRAVVKGNTATLKVTLGVYDNGKMVKSKWKQVLRLKMVKEGGSWKIDRINDN